jgi:hypothetical protein
VTTTTHEVRRDSCPSGSGRHNGVPIELTPSGGLPPLLDEPDCHYRAVCREDPAAVTVCHGAELQRYLQAAGATGTTSPAAM